MSKFIDELGRLRDAGDKVYVITSEQDESDFMSVVIGDVQDDYIVCDIGCSILDYPRKLIPIRNILNVYTKAKPEHGFFKFSHESLKLHVHTDVEDNPIKIEAGKVYEHIENGYTVLSVDDSDTKSFKGVVVFDHQQTKQDRFIVFNVHTYACKDFKESDYKLKLVEK